MNDKVFNPNLFTAIDLPSEFNLIVGQDFNTKIYFIYNGTDNRYEAKLFGNPKTTGIETTNLVHESEGRFSIHLFGTPKLINKNYFRIRLSNESEYMEVSIPYTVEPLKFLDYNLPDALGVLKEYTTRIHFYNPSKFKPKFAYHFPVEFGRVFTEIKDSIDYTTIKLVPTRPGKFKFFIQALSQDNILMGSRTLHLKVIDTETPKPTKPTTPIKVESIDFKDW